MASAVTQTGGYSATVVGPDDGDTRNAASVRQGFEDAAQRTTFMRKHMGHWAKITITAGVAAVDESSTENDDSTPAITAAVVGTQLVVTLNTAKASANYFAHAVVESTAMRTMLPVSRTVSAVTFNYYVGTATTTLVGAGVVCYVYIAGGD